jgi:hypothetical protein
MSKSWLAGAQIRQQSMQEAFQSRTASALRQLAQATQTLNGSQDLEHTNQIDTLLEDIVRQQNDLAEKHEAWADLNGDISKTVQLGITEVISKAAPARCVPHVTLHVRAWLIVPLPCASCASGVPFCEPLVVHTSPTSPTFFASCGIVASCMRGCRGRGWNGAAMWLRWICAKSDMLVQLMAKSTTRKCTTNAPFRF